MNMSAGANANVAVSMNRGGYPAAAGGTAGGTAGASRAYPQTAEPEPKQIPTEQVQAILDENSGLIVDIITLNNQIKHGKGTTQLSEFTDKLDKKRKQLNKNLMTLAKWADESTEQPPRPVVPPQQQQQQQQHLQQQQQQHLQQQQQQQQQQQMYAPMQHSQQMQYPRAMAMNPMAGAQQQVMPGQPNMAMNQAQAQAQAQARYAQAQAYAQYQARLNSMGGVHPQYAQQMGQQMGQAAVAQVQQQQQQQQQRYHVNNMGYGNPVVQQQQQQQHPGLAHQMPMGQQQPQMQPMYDDGSGQMGYQTWAPN